MSQNGKFSASLINCVPRLLYVVEAGDLSTVCPDNLLCKYAHYTYVIIPASNNHTRFIEIDNIEAWAKANSLTLNRSKL